MKIPSKTLLLAVIIEGAACYGVPEGDNAVQAVTQPDSGTRPTTQASVSNVGVNSPQFPTRQDGGAGTDPVHRGQTFTYAVSDVGGCGRHNNSEQTFTVGDCTYTVLNTHCSYTPVGGGLRVCMCDAIVSETLGNCDDVPPPR